MELNQNYVTLSSHQLLSHDIAELVYNKNDTFLILIKKNDKLSKLLMQANSQIADLTIKYTQLEAKSQKDKAAILRQLDQISITYKTYAESHKNLQLTKKKSKELLDNNISLANRVQMLQNTNIASQTLINDLYQMIMDHSINDSSGKFVEYLRSYMNEKFKAIREEIAISYNNNKKDILTKTVNNRNNLSHSNSNHNLNQTVMVKSRKESSSNQMIYLKPNTRPFTPKIGFLNEQKEAPHTKKARNSIITKDKLKSGSKSHRGSRQDIQFGSYSSINSYHKSTSKNV